MIKKYYLTIFLIILLSLISAVDSFAQKFPIRSYSIENGLSQSVVNAIYQTSDGFIWIGTEYGLNRYDGFSFEAFHTEQGLAENNILYMGNSPNDDLLVGTSSGISLLSNHRFFDYDFADFASDYFITKFAFLNESMLVSTDGNGFFIRTGSEIQHFDENNGLPSSRVLDFLITEEEHVYLATHDGIVRIIDGEIELIEGLNDNRAHVISLSPNNNILVGTDEGLHLIRMEESTYSIEQFNVETGLADNAIRSITKDDNDGLWIGTENGISYYHDGDIFNYSEQQGLSNTIVISGFMDREGIMWFGTYGGGVNLFPGRYAENFTIDNGLSNNVVTSFQSLSSNTTWVSTFGGGITEFSDDGFRHIRKEDGLIDNRVYTLFKDSQERIWIGTQSGISRYQNGEFVTVEESDATSGGKIRAINEMQNGDFWIGTYGNGVSVFTQSGIRRFTTQNGLPDNIVMNVLESSNGDIQLATYGGLATWRNQSFEVLNTNNGLTHNSVLHLHEDDSDVLWISTFRGITLKKGDQLRTITMADGLPDNVCYFVTQDESGRYWIGTNRGITRLSFDDENPMESDFKLVTYTTESAMVSNETNTGAIFNDDQNRLWIGTVGGLTRLTPSLIPESDSGPIVHIQSIRVFDRELRPEMGIVLDHDQNFVGFSFAGLSFRSPSQVYYEYKLKGVDSQWQTTRQREVRYTTLPRGTHEFRVRAFDQNGNASPMTASTSIQILPPFWLTWWFILIIVAGFAGLIYLFYYNYKISQEVELERVRIRIASDLHDDVGASLTEIALNTDLLRASPIPESFKESVALIGDLSRNIVTTMDDIVWSIDARNDSIGDLTDRMQDYATSVLTPRNIDIDFQFEGLDNVTNLPVEFRQNLYLIFKEAVNNIAKHASATKAVIGLKKMGSFYRLEIHDDGSGMGEQGRRGGQGLKNMQLRADRIFADFKIKQENGTSIIVETRQKI